MNHPKPPSTAYSGKPTSKLRFTRSDPERLLFLPCGKFTSPSLLTPIMFSSVLLVVIYSFAYFWRDQYPEISKGMGINAYDGIPIYIIALSVWSLVILAFKYLKIRSQRKSLKILVVPNSSGFVLSASTVDQVIEKIESNVENPRCYMLFNRILLVLKSIRNVGRIADIDDMLSSSADADDSRIENSYTIVRGFIWAIPVLGFIGTILGLTKTITSFNLVLDSDVGKSNNDTLKKFDMSGMLEVISGLDTAFYTTGIALVAALFIHLILTFIRKSDDDLLDDTREYCKTHIVAKVRV